MTQRKLFDNTIPGAELRAIIEDRTPRRHVHSCPRCERIWEHKEFFCRNMEIAEVHEGGETVKSVPWLCDACLGTRPEEEVKYVEPKKHVEYGRGGPEAA